MNVPIGYRMAPDSEVVWMSCLPEKYEERLETPEFEGMCLADFASGYRTLWTAEKPFTFLQNITMGKSSIIRFPHFSEMRDLEKSYRCLLKLYRSHRSNNNPATPRSSQWQSVAVCGSLRQPVACPWQLYLFTHFNVFCTS